MTGARRATTAAWAVLLAANAASAVGKEAAPPRSFKAVALVRGFCGAWNARNPVERDRLLEQVFAADGVYRDPTPTYAVGRSGLRAAIKQFHHDYPGARFLCSAPQVHHRAMRVSWLLIRPDGTTEARGMDFYELTRNGMIQQVTGFFGAPPEVKP